MELRSLGNSTVYVSAIGLGCAGLSEGYGPADPQQSMRTLLGALEEGINFFDSADVYGNGSNEELLGQFIHGRRQSVVLATKFGLVRKPDAAPVNNSPPYVQQACEASLRRLNTDVIDLYYLQRRDHHVPIEDVIGAMARLVQDGKVRHLGLSEVSPDTLRRAHAVHPIAAIQSEYSLFTREPESGMLDACRELGVTFVAYCPVGRGLLTGGLPAIDTLDGNDLRRRLPRFQGQAFQHNAELATALDVFARAHHATKAHIALAWLLCKHPHVVPIPGSKQPQHVIENAAATRIKLSAGEITRLDELFAPAAVLGERYPPQVMAMVETY